MKFGFRKCGRQDKQSTVAKGVSRCRIALGIMKDNPNKSSMLKRRSLVIIAMCLSTLLQAQGTLTKGQQDVQQTIINFFECLSNRDSVGLKSYSATDITLLEYGQIWNLDTLIRRAIKLNTARDFKRSNSIKFINSSTDKNTAWATYYLTSKFVRTGNQSTVQWLESVILVREKKKWKLKALHSTVIKRTTEK